MVIALLITAALWMSWAWKWSPAWGIVGALAILLGHAAFLAFELLLLPAISRGDPSPRPSFYQRLRAWAVETVQDLNVFAWRQPFRWRAVPDCLSDPRGGRMGVVLIHGFACNRGFWTPWLRRLREDGRVFVAVNLEPLFAEIDRHVPTVNAAVEQVRQATGRPPVLICHSMGGLVARAWLRTQPSDPVSRVITIATPHRGTWIANFSRAANGRQMRPDSDWLRQLESDVRIDLASRFTCWYSNCDNVVMPPLSATLPGADNRLVEGAAHVELAFRPDVMDAALALIDDEPSTDPPWPVS